MKKRFICLLLGALISLCAVVPAFAADNTSSDAANEYGDLNWSYFFSDTSIAYISSNFGPRSSGEHYGFDITTGVAGGINGTQILSVTGGTVKNIGLDTSASAGYYIAIETNSTDPLGSKKLWTTYMHMKERPKKSNGTNWATSDTVATGNLLGLVGNTGQVTGYHLHFQVNTNGQVSASSSYSNVVNPIHFFPNISFKGDTSIYSGNTASSYVNDDDMNYLIDIRLVDYVGEDLVLEWINSSTESKNIIDFCQEFGITGELFMDLCQQFDLSEMYNAAEISMKLNQQD